MRKKIIAGNWKMNLTFAEAMALADNLLDENKNIDDEYFGNQCGDKYSVAFYLLHKKTDQKNT